MLPARKLLWQILFNSFTRSEEREYFSTSDDRTRLITFRVCFNARFERRSRNGVITFFAKKPLALRPTKSLLEFNRSANHEPHNFWASLTSLECYLRRVFTKLREHIFANIIKNSTQVHLCINLENAKLQKNNFESLQEHGEQVSCDRVL